ncbi:MAG TPA: protocatechuate 3,4-dioxygenase subunit alpha [Terracidiphilus sp.]|jgi:protocatechuate 3,4-dioxygenase alpha subunit
MTTASASISTGSQTVGPYFRIGLEHLLDCAPALVADGENFILIQGILLDGDRKPVPDAVLEFWASGHEGSWAVNGFPPGFRRVPTDAEGRFFMTIERPAAVTVDGTPEQAPHLAVAIFMRGLLRHLLTRVYLADEAALSSDPVLNAIPSHRRATLFAQPDFASRGAYHWDVTLQGELETVFFAW